MVLFILGRLLEHLNTDDYDRENLATILRNKGRFYEASLVFDPFHQQAKIWAPLPYTLLRQLAGEEHARGQEDQARVNYITSKIFKCQDLEVFKDWDLKSAQDSNNLLSKHTKHLNQATAAWAKFKPYRNNTDSLSLRRLLLLEDWLITEHARNEFSRKYVLFHNLEPLGEELLTFEITGITWGHPEIMKARAEVEHFSIACENNRGSSVIDILEKHLNYYVTHSEELDKLFPDYDTNKKKVKELLLQHSRNSPGQ